MPALSKSKRPVLTPKPKAGLESGFNFSAWSGVLWGFVCAGIDQAAGALKDELKAKRWVKSIASKEIESEGDHFVPFKLVGNNWTNLVDISVSGKKDISVDLLKAVSKKLKTRTIFAAYESTAGIFLYVLCDNGKVVEMLHWDGSTKSQMVKTADAASAGFSFYSDRRRIRPGELTNKTVVKFFDSFLKSQGAFLVLESGTSRRELFTFKPHRVKASEIERADYVGILSESEMRDAKARRKLDSELADAIDGCNEAYFWAFKGREEYKDWRHMRPTRAACVKHEARFRRHLSKIKRILGEGIKPQERWINRTARDGNQALLEVLCKAAGYAEVPDSLKNAALQEKAEEDEGIQKVLAYIGDRKSILTA